MYFPGDPLFALDPIYQAITDPAARERLVATYDHDVTQPEWCTGYRWDIVLTGAPPHPARGEDDASERPHPRPARPSARSSATRCRTTAATSSCRRPGRTRSGCTAGCSTAPATRCPTRCRALAGRPRRHVSARAGLAAPRRLRRSPAGAGRRPTAPGTTSSRRCRADRAGRRAVLRDHGLRPRAARPAVHPRLPARDERPWRPTRCSRSVDPERRPTLVARATTDGFVFDIRLQGDGRDRLPLLRGHD